MTITVETGIDIGAPPERVWATLVDFAGYGAWNPYLVRVEGEARAGATITVHSLPVPGGEPMAQPVAVVSVDPPRAMRWEGGLPDRAQFKGDHWFVLEPSSARTRFRHFEHFTGALAPALLEKHGDLIRGNFERFNRALKARCEGADG